MEEFGREQSVAIKCEVNQYSSDGARKCWKTEVLYVFTSVVLS
jgi:hypothetical protein